jgi:hypothetical protein
MLQHERIGDEFGGNVGYVRGGYHGVDFMRWRAKLE